MDTSASQSPEHGCDKLFRQRRWTLLLLMMIAAALIVSGILWVMVPIELAARSESEILSGSPIPAPAEQIAKKCNSIVEFSFDRNASEADVDQAIGPRVEKWDRVQGARARIVGTAKDTSRGGARIVGTADEPFDIKRIDDSGFGFKWPEEIEGRSVVVEGCLGRIFYPSQLQRPDTSKWTDRQKQVRSSLRAYPTGFVYELHNYTYRLADESAGSEASEGGPADGDK